MDPEFGGTGYILTASVAAVGGYGFASMRYAPRIADLAQRVASTERNLSGQGQAICELSDALKCLLAELDGADNPPSQREAIAAARWVLANRQSP